MYLDVTPPDYDELAPNVEMKLSGDTKGRAKGSGYGPDGNALYTSNVTAEVTVEEPNWGNASGPVSYTHLNSSTIRICQALWM